MNDTSDKDNYDRKRFGKVWVEFLKVVRSLGERKTDQDASKGSLRDLLEEVVQELSSERSIAVTVSCTAALEDTQQRVLETLIREIEYYNNRYRDVTSESEVDKGLNDAGIVQQSVEDLIEELPKRIRRWLKILNALLRLS